MYLCYWIQEVPRSPQALADKTFWGSGATRCRCCADKVTSRRAQGHPAGHQEFQDAASWQPFFSWPPFASSPEAILFKWVKRVRETAGPRANTQETLFKVRRQTCGADSNSQPASPFAGAEQDPADGRRSTTPTCFAPSPAYRQS